MECYLQAGNHPVIDQPLGHRNADRELRKGEILHVVPGALSRHRTLRRLVPGHRIARRHPQEAVDAACILYYYAEGESSA